MSVEYEIFYVCDVCRFRVQFNLQSLLDRGWHIGPREGGDRCPIHNPEWEPFMEWDAFRGMTRDENPGP